MTTTIKEEGNYLQVGEMTACGHCDDRFKEGLKEAERLGIKCECKCHKKPMTKSIREEKKEMVVGEWGLCPKCKRPWKFHNLVKLDLMPNVLNCPTINKIISL